MTNSLRKREVLRGKKEFRQIFEAGHTLKGNFVVCKFVHSPPSGAAHRPLLKAAFVVGKNVRRAVDRNRLKRFLREAYRLNKEILVRGQIERSGDIDLVFIGSPRSAVASGSLTFSDIENDVKTMLARVNDNLREQMK